MVLPCVNSSLNNTKQRDKQIKSTTTQRLKMAQIMTYHQVDDINQNARALLHHHNRAAYLTM